MTEVTMPSPRGTGRPSADQDSRAASAAPDFLSPHYHVTMKPIGRQSTIYDVTERVTSLTHTDTGARSTSKVALNLDNSDDFLFAMPAFLEKGTLFTVDYGYPNLMRNAGGFVAREHSGGSKQLEVVAYEAKRAKLGRAMQSRIWRNMTASQIARDVLMSAGVSADSLFIDETDLILPSTMQVKEDNWAFVRGLADRSSRLFWVDETGFYWTKTNHGRRPSHLFRYVKGVIGADMIEDFKIESFGAGVPGRINFRGMDPMTKRLYEVTASDEDTKELDPIVDTDDFRAPLEGDKETGGDTGYEILANLGVRSEVEARTIADALYREYRFSALKVTLNIFGDPSVRVNEMTLVQGCGPIIDGKYRMTEATHTLGDGYKTVLKIARDGVDAKKGVGNNLPSFDLFLGIRDTHIYRNTGTGEESVYK